ncbi:MAG: hypothetical protein GY861_18080 [bacterium]|nr:hypothetical protein [bacterium]
MAFDEVEQKIIKYGLDGKKSRQEIERAIINYRTQSNPLLAKPPEQIEFEDQQSGFQETMQDITQIGSDIKGTYQSRAGKVADALDDYKQKKQGLFKTATQVFGQGALAVTESVGHAVTGGAKTGFSQEQEEAIAGGVEKAVTPIVESDVVQSALERYDSLDDSAKRDIDTVLGVTGLGLDVAGGLVLKQGVKAGVKSGTKTAKRLAENVTDTAGVSLKPVSNVADYTVSRSPKAMGIFSAEGDDVVKAFLANPEAADIGLRQGDEALKAVITRGRKNAFDMKENVVKGHALAKEKIMGNYTKALVPKKEINKHFDDLLKEYDVVKNKDGSLNFDRSKITINPGEVSQINKVLKRLNAMSTATVNELDDFKQFVNGLVNWKTTIGAKKSSALLKRFGYQLDETITSKLPKDISKQYSVLNENFSKTIRMYNDFVNAFEKGDPFKRVAGVFGQNNATIRELMTKYEALTGEKVFSTVAGRAIGMEKAAPFGFLNPRSWIDLLVSPQTQGRIIAKTGEKIPRKHLEPFGTTSSPKVKPTVKSKK